MRKTHIPMDDRPVPPNTEYVYECQQCGKWNVEKVCQDDDDSDIPGCGEKVNLKRIRREW